jgi:ribosomal protein S6--L-glutamate ligase
MRSQQQVIIQEFIKEAVGEDIRVLVVGGKVVASMRRVAAAGEFRSNLHRGGSGYRVQLSEEEQVVALKAAEVMGLSVAGIDMLRSKRGPLVLEVNASPGLEGIEGVTGVDVAGHIIKMIEENRNIPQ